MEQIILDMLEEAEETQNLNLVKYVHGILFQFSHNLLYCPQAWTDIRENIFDAYQSDSWSLNELLKLDNVSINTALDEPKTAMEKQTIITKEEEK